ncbi:MAG: DUF262 domain-containing HNH endonuclease family protein [Cyanobacteria bacterium J06588_5]
MSQKILLNTRTTNFGELISNGRRYRVPLFQRDYSWKPENWEDLWQDIIDSHNNQETHYMGAIVLQGSTGDRELTIIDGQQRIATLSILAISVIQKIKELESRDVEPAQNIERQIILRRNFLGDKSPSSLRYSSKLFLNENNDSFYQSNLINLRPPKAFRSLRKSNQLLWKAFEYFSDQLETMPSIAESGAGLSSFLTDTIARLLLFIQINVEDEIDAYVVFETLNSRGVELSSTDLLKNYLFSRFKGSTDDLNAARIEWQEITRTVGMEKFPEFLRYFLSMNRRRVRSTQLFKIIKTQVVTAEASFELLNQLNNFSRLYVALGNHNDDFWLDYKPQFKQYVRELNLFRTKQAYPALFAAYERFSERELEKLLKIVTIVSFRYTVVSRLNPNELEAQYNTLAMEISEGKVKTAKAAFNVISSILYIEDSKFEQDFALLAIPTKRKKGLVQYILRQLEKDRTNKDIPEDSFSIEHILPQEPDESWRQNFPETQIEEAIYRVGNMTPLESSLNRKIGRESYDKKRQAYEQSVYSITKDIQAEDWTMDSVVWRQERMAKRAVHIWRVNY